MQRRTLNLIGRIRENINQYLMAELDKNGAKGIVPSHGEILMVLYQHDAPMPLKDIAEKIRRTQPTVTVLVKKLAKYGYIQRHTNQEDKRSTYVVLTEKGRDFRTVFNKISLDVNKKLHKGLSKDEADALEKTLVKILHNL